MYREVYGVDSDVKMKQVISLFINLFLRRATTETCSSGQRRNTPSITNYLRARDAAVSWAVATKRPRSVLQTG